MYSRSSASSLPLSLWWLIRPTIEPSWIKKLNFNLIFSNFKSLEMAFSRIYHGNLCYHKKNSDLYFCIKYVYFLFSLYFPGQQQINLFFWSNQPILWRRKDFQIFKMCKYNFCFCLIIKLLKSAGYACLM